MAKKPTLKVRSAASTNSNSRIAEATWPDGSGCLIELRTNAVGIPILEVYRADEKIMVVTPSGAWSFGGGKS